MSEFQESVPSLEPVLSVPATQEFQAEVDETVQPGHIVHWIQAARERVREEGFVGAAQNRADKALAAEMTRRRFLRGSAGVAVGAVLASQLALLEETTHELDQAFDKQWPHTDSVMHFVGEKPRDPRELAIYFPGFGDLAGPDEAASIRTTGQVAPDIPLAYLDYSNQGASIAQMAEAVREQVDVKKLESVTMVCRSLGGPFGLGTAAELGVPVKNIIFIASPFGIGDGDMANIGAVLARLPDARTTDAAIKYAINLWNNAHGEATGTPWDDFTAATAELFGALRGQGSFHQALNGTLTGLDKFSVESASAWQSVMTGANPLASQHELRTWYNEHLSTDPAGLPPDTLHKLRAVFKPGYTQLMYTATEHPNTDETVKVIASAQHYREFAQRVLRLRETDMQFIGLPYNGHADMGATMRSTRVQRWFRDNTTDNPKPQPAIAAGKP